MRFSTRNAYYLRISATTVLPLYLYLDERHIEWMSERVLQHVLADLRPLIIPKLNAEIDSHLGQGGPANAKRGTLDVHRGDTYQFGYFLRGTEPHAVLIKTRTFTAAPPRPRGPPPPPPVSETCTGRGHGRSKKVNTGPTKTGKKRKPKPRPKGKGKARALDDEDEAISISSGDDIVGDELPAEPIATRRSKRARQVIAGGYREDEHEDVQGSENAEADGIDDEAMEIAQPQLEAPVVLKMEETEPVLVGEPGQENQAEPMEEDSEVIPASMDVELVDDEEEPKPKPILKLRYHGFNIHGRCLCVIVEPYPPIRSATRAPSLAPTGLIAPRAPSIAPPDFVPSGGSGQRERTPLFLPDFDRDPTPAPSIARNLPPVPLFSESAEDSDGEDGGMVLFSQILRSVGDHPPGIAEDDDEIDGAVFFGDADEMREL
ncbi:hypothetical protein L226DRAFT_131430 [Lentinus tigrinus ALCF2SS1-7]|uniref:Uncharacterized protein n=1 Tax=Lentinus tigrinus ALCF2SS1-6 TaxID=1328759 RepID=A0A5C2STP8_9APHY|nr:hypothetical protein L227DRAFT_569407 [Lentinus tigrinus ALCF2SS1-6]RPD81174.1 hypothetical protein L226DRAFT_131430 [Lentinus tigrinus ALCF2SS1-7]